MPGGLTNDFPRAWVLPMIHRYSRLKPARHSLLQQNWGMPPESTAHVPWYIQYILELGPPGRWGKWMGVKRNERPADSAGRPRAQKKVDSQKKLFQLQREQTVTLAMVRVIGWFEVEIPFPTGILDDTPEFSFARNKCNIPSKYTKNFALDYFHELCFNTNFAKICIPIIHHLNKYLFCLFRDCNLWFW